MLLEVLGSDFVLRGLLPTMYGLHLLSLWAQARYRITSRVKQKAQLYCGVIVVLPCVLYGIAPHDLRNSLVSVINQLAHDTGNGTCTLNPDTCFMDIVIIGIVVSLSLGFLLVEVVFFCEKTAEAKEAKEAKKKTDEEDET